MTSPFTYSDLFAGIGGFHAALSAMGGECVYAVEIDKDAARVYEQNWGIDPLGDITNDAGDAGVTDAIQAHDVLAAGFPCQPFSKSGAQKGMEEVRGTLYFNILQIVHKHHPTVLLLENVRNLAGPRHKHEWEVIVRTLRKEGYRVSSTPAILSPHQISPERGGRPQVRERVFITATYNPDGIGESEPEPVARPGTLYGEGATAWDLEAFLLDEAEGYELSEAETEWINAWDDWVERYRRYNPGQKLPGFPIWVDAWQTIEALEAQIDAGEHDDVPAWKMNFLRKNAELYTRNEAWCRAWKTTSGVMGFPPSRRKLEWQAQDLGSLWDCLMHFRPSGLRAKPPTYAPALVAITQTSIVGPRRRRLAPRETARLQGLPDGFSFDGQPDAKTYKQLGNGVNVGAVWNIFKLHCERDRDILETTEAGRRILEAVSAAPANPEAPVAALLTQ
ncbi:MAG: DNA (cytosine-5-)-methyltransferase [Actinomyces sp.]|uniref:DNA (cytosine-5-)-methyltransferase n=1 Tax=Actinomyces sp. TaxID=29317 RepID=UPI0026DAFEB9|nr:DNA (cytosine-5-)-methyltransferase [Actinomyces sp.]MDO4242832.1 DNA (cytosine-5-)-methyltransferase [Actinomyces sp.]